MNTQIRVYEVEIIKDHLMEVVEDICQKNPNTTWTIKGTSTSLVQCHTVRVVFESSSEGLIWSLRGWLSSDGGIVDWTKLSEENLSPAK